MKEKAAGLSNVDVMLLEPGVTRTNLVTGLAKNPLSDTAAACVSGALRDLGLEDVTPGALGADIVERLLFVAIFFFQISGLMLIIQAVFGLFYNHVLKKSNSK